MCNYAICQPGTRRRCSSKAPARPRARSRACACPALQFISAALGDPGRCLTRSATSLRTARYAVGVWRFGGRPATCRVTWKSGQRRSCRQTKIQWASRPRNLNSVRPPFVGTPFLFVGRLAWGFLFGAFLEGVCRGLQDEHKVHDLRQSFTTGEHT